ncbi:hypothetical protein SM033_00142 [Vibrio phage vB_VpaM_sm033]|nr:hypothetical protein SM033_00142 [Vibrio phage vB_VpaM_sm033]
MYTLQRSYVFDDVFQTWSRKDLSLFKISEIMEIPDFKLVLTTAEDPDEEFVVMKQTLTEWHSDFVGRFALSIWLSTFTEDLLVRSDRPVKLPDIKYLESRELFRTGARVINVNVIGDDLEVKARRTPEQQYGTLYFHRNCLAVINRRVYKFDEYLEDVYIYHGATRLREDDDYAVNVLDFGDLGGVGHTWVREDQVTDLTNDDDRQNNNIRFRVVLDEDVIGKTPFVVVGGDLNLLNDTIFQADARTFVITLDREKLIKQVFKDKVQGEKLDFIYNANIRGGGLREDTLDIAKLMAHWSSFMGWVNFTNLLVRVEHIPQPRTPDMYQFYRYPKGMIHFSDGEIAQPTIFDYNQHLCSFMIKNTVEKDWMMNHQNWDETVAKTQTGASQPFRIRDIYVRDIYWF